MSGSDDNDGRGRKRPAGAAGRDRRSELRGPEALEEIERRLGGLLGGLSGALGRLSDALPSDDGAPGAKDGGGSRLRAEVSVRVGGLSIGRAGASDEHDAAEDRDPARPVATAAPAAAPDAGDAPRTAQIEVYETDEEWVLTAEIPGVELDEVAFRIEHGRLHLATTGRRVFTAETEVPGWLEAADLAPGLVNGILELRARRPAGPETRDEGSGQ